jgi:putative flippase GtrA
VAVTLHFFLQREFVFKHETGFHMSTRDQVKRYLVIGVAQYAVTWTSTHFLPSALGLPVSIVYLATVAVCTVAAFLVMRLHVFAPAAGNNIAASQPGHEARTGQD